MTNNTSHERHRSAPVVELVYDVTCPNVESCRAALRAAMAQVGLSPSWTEWDRNGPATPSSYRPYGSPTVLVDGRDIAEAPGGAALSVAPSGNSCRVYTGDTQRRLSGVPPVQSIVCALTARATSPITESVV